MTNQNRSSSDVVHQRPAWILPVLVALAVAAFSGLFLYYYFGPTPEEILGRSPRASAATRRVEAIVGGTRFLIPENFTRYPSQRNGGTESEIAMHALLPDFDPWSPDLQTEFEDNSPNANVIFFTLEESKSILPAAQRLKDIYARYFTTNKPEASVDGLEKFTFREDSGYRDQDLFVGKDHFNRIILLTCEHETQLIHSPNCSRTLLLTRNLSLTYRYKRSHLNEWQRIDELITRKVASFEAPGLPNDLEGTINE